MAFAYADSALTVLQREIGRGDDFEARHRALNELQIASGSVAHIVERAGRHSDNIEEFFGSAVSLGLQQRYIDAYGEAGRGGRFSVVYKTVDTVPDPESSEQYWRRLRDELQARFTATLAELRPLVGIAYPTLVNLGKRKPHPSTARAVLQLHGLTTHALRTRGSDSGAAWLASVGRRILERDGFEAFKEAVIGESERRPLWGVSFEEEPEAEASYRAMQTPIEGERF